MKKIMLVLAGIVSVASFAAEVQFKAGFGRADITPALGTQIPGYFCKRLGVGVLDRLEATAVAVSDGKKTAVIVGMDTISTDDNATAAIVKAVGEATGLPREAMFLHSSHTHTGGSTRNVLNVFGGVTEAELPAIAAYIELIAKRTAEAAKAALDDLAPAEIAAGRTRLERHAFIRRYRMKDGTARTNPDTTSSDVVGPIGETDTMVQVLRFMRAAPKKEITIINFQNHPDVIGGNYYSADWPGFVRRTFEAAVEESHCLFVNGAQGDTNHFVYKPRQGEKVREIYDPENKGYSYKRYQNSRHLGQMVAGAALTVWGRCDRIEAGEIGYGIVDVKVPSNRPKPEEMPLARKYHEAHKNRIDGVIPATGMEYTTLIADAARKIRLEHGPDYFNLPVSAITIGKSLAFAGFPGEPFTEIGLRVKKDSPFKMTLVGCTTNGSKGYFPTRGAYAEGGYEARTSSFAGGVDDCLVEGQLRLLKSLSR